MRQEGFGEPLIQAFCEWSSKEISSYPDLIMTWALVPRRIKKKTLRLGGNEGETALQNAINKITNDLKIRAMWVLKLDPHRYQRLLNDLELIKNNS
jgi:hypothetical protein